MFIRGVFMHAKPRALRSLRGRLRTKSFPCCEVKKASGTKSPWLPRACQSNGNQPLWDQKENADVYGRRAYSEVPKAQAKVAEETPSVGFFEVPDSTLHEIAARGTP
jgi:hypothetical protein